MIKLLVVLELCILITTTTTSIIIITISSKTVAQTGISISYNMGSDVAYLVLSFSHKFRAAQSFSVKYNFI
jgi:hypothetical protein